MRCHLAGELEQMYAQTPRNTLRINKTVLTGGVHFWGGVGKTGFARNKFANKVKNKHLSNY